MTTKNKNVAMGLASNDLHIYSFSKQALTCYIVDIEG